ncbi:MAG: hypothetical protein WEA76_00040 [Acidimicrobiia bacterium]
MIERFLILFIVVGLALAVVLIRERMRPRSLSVQPGITVFTGPDCRLCPPLIAALDAAGAEYRTVDVSVSGLGVGVRSLPTVVVADMRGDIALRRSGRSAVVDVDTILAVASSGGVVRESA